MKARLAALLSLLLLTVQLTPASAQQVELRCGIIGLDTSHAIAFTRLLNDPQAAPELAGCRVVAAYPKGSPDIESSVSRVPNYIKDVQELGVEIVPSIEVLLTKVDVVLLETNDGRPHLEQVLPVLRAGKRVFIDKPIAGSLADAVAIFEAAEKYKTPVFSSSSLRYVSSAQEARRQGPGEIVGCLTYSPASLEKTHPDLFLVRDSRRRDAVYGHGDRLPVRHPCPHAWGGRRRRHVERRPARHVPRSAGRQEGLRRHGFWQEEDGALGLLRGLPAAGCRDRQVFRGGATPIAPAETLEIYAFMAAADASKQAGGCPVTLAEMMERARRDAHKRLAELDR